MIPLAQARIATSGFNAPKVSNTWDGTEMSAYGDVWNGGMLEIQFGTPIDGNLRKMQVYRTRYPSSQDEIAGPPNQNGEATTTHALWFHNAEPVTTDGFNWVFGKLWIRQNLSDTEQVQVSYGMPVNTWFNTTTWGNSLSWYHYNEFGGQVNLELDLTYDPTFTTFERHRIVIGNSNT